MCVRLRIPGVFGEVRLLSLAVLEVRKGAGRDLGVSIAVRVLLQLAGAALLDTNEDGAVPLLTALLAWASFNFFWLALFRRPALATGLSLTMVFFLSILSKFKHNALMMTVTFLDVQVVDTDTMAFLLTTFPDLGWEL